MAAAVGEARCLWPRDDDVEAAGEHQNGGLSPKAPGDVKTPVRKNVGGDEQQSDNGAGADDKTGKLRGDDRKVLKLLQPWKKPEPQRAKNGRILKPRTTEDAALDTCRKALKVKVEDESEDLKIFAPVQCVGMSMFEKCCNDLRRMRRDRRFSHTVRPGYIQMLREQFLGIELHLKVHNHREVVKASLVQALVEAVGGRKMCGPLMVIMNDELTLAKCNQRTVVTCCRAFVKLMLHTDKQRECAMLCLEQACKCWGEKFVEECGALAPWADRVLQAQFSSLKRLGGADGANCWLRSAQAWAKPLKMPLAKIIELMDKHWGCLDDGEKVWLSDMCCQSWLCQALFGDLNAALILTDSENVCKEVLKTMVESGVCGNDENKAKYLADCKASVGVQAWEMEREAYEIDVSYGVLEYRHLTRSVAESSTVRWAACLHASAVELQKIACMPGELDWIPTHEYTGLKMFFKDVCHNALKSAHLARRAILEGFAKKKATSLGCSVLKVATDMHTMLSSIDKAWRYVEAPLLKMMMDPRHANGRLESLLVKNVKDSADADDLEKRISTIRGSSVCEHVDSSMVAVVDWALKQSRDLQSGHILEGCAMPSNISTAMHAFRYRTWMGIARLCIWRDSETKQEFRGKSAAEKNLDHWQRVFDRQAIDNDYHMTTTDLNDCMQWRNLLSQAKQSQLENLAKAVITTMKKQHGIQPAVSASCLLERQTPPPKKRRGNDPESVEKEALAAAIMDSGLEAELLSCS